MKFTLLLLISLFFYDLRACAQSDPEPLNDTTLAKKITIAGFCLCKTTLSDLIKLSDDFKQITVEEMDLGKRCIAEDSRFENGKGYYSDKYPGLVFQKEKNSDKISKIQLTTKFKGNLPDGTLVDLSCCYDGIQRQQCNQTCR